MKINNNKLFLLILLIIQIYFISCLSTPSVDDDINEVETTQNCKPLLNDKEVTKKKTPKKNKEFEIVGLEESLDYLDTVLEYPEFKDLEGLNKHLRNLIESGWLDFKYFADKDWHDVTSLNSSDLPPYEYLVNTDVSYSGDLISVYFNIYSYKGGAHGHNTIKTVNYNKKADKYLTITEATGYSYDELSDICRKKLYNLLISENRFEIEQEQVTILTEMIDEGTSPIAANFENYILDNKKLKIFFEQGKVAPHYYGELSVDLEL